jgi:fructose-bisphosphate aldolase class II
MPITNMKDMLVKASKGKYAVGQFNINNLEWSLAILNTAEELGSPVILGVSEGAAKYMGGFKVVVAMIKALDEEKHYTIPIAIHLDHGSSYEVCKAAIDAGFSSVMIDASHFSLEENIAITKKVVDYAKPFNVSVESELGRVGGQEEHVVAETMYAIPSECLELVKKTKIDALAPALGSVHGPYQGEPKLGFKEMEEIAKLVKIPLVLHGGSGIYDDLVKKAISLGTAKINVNTESQQAWTAIVREVIANDTKVYDPRKIIGPGMKGISAVVKEKITLFGSVNKK